MWEGRCAGEGDPPCGSCCVSSCCCWVAVLLSLVAWVLFGVDLGSPEKPPWGSLAGALAVEVASVVVWVPLLGCLGVPEEPSWDALAAVVALGWVLSGLGFGCPCAGDWGAHG